MTLDIHRHAHHLQAWLKKPLPELTAAATYTLAYNASLMVEDGMGVCLTLEKLIRVTEDSSLCFRPLSTPLLDRLHVVWKKYQVFSQAARHFLALLRAQSVL